MKLTELKMSKSLLGLAVATLFVLAVFVTACKTEASAPTVWKVTIDQNGGTGLTKLVYEVNDGDTLKQSDLEGTPTFEATKDMINAPANIGRVLSGYKTTGGDDFTLDNTAVKGDITIKQQWVIDPALDCSAKTNAKTQLLTYAQGGDIIGVACSLKEGASLSDVDTNGNTALLMAANNGNFELIKYLLANGSSVDEKSNSSQTALLIASRNLNIDIVKYLVAHGANVGARDIDGATPLMRATAYGNLETVKILITNGANMGDQDNKGYTALLYTADFGQLDIAKYLLANGSKITEKDNEGKTALMISLRNRLNWTSDDSTNLVKFFATYTGVDLSTRATSGTYNGKTALGMAKVIAASDPTDTVYPEIVTYFTNIHVPE